MEKLKKWPQQWLENFVKYCELYFYDKPINFNGTGCACYHSNTNEEAFGAEFDFSIGCFSYLVEISRWEKTFTSSIYYFDQNLTYDINLGGFSTPEGFYYEIAGLGGDLQLSFIVDTIETIIMGDSERRRREKGDDGGDDGGSDDPIVPFSPFESLSPDLITT